MRPQGMKLSLRHRTWFYSVFSVLYLSGLAWMIVHFLISGNDLEMPVHPLEPFFLSMHGAAAMAALILLGTLIPIHIKRAWAANINRGNGMALISVSLLLTLTGYAFYYVGNETLDLLSQWIHLVLGALFPAFLIWHITQGRKARKLASKRSYKPRKNS